MSHLKPSYDDEELKGSVDFDFFSDGPESARQAENDALPSARSGGSHHSSNLSSNRTPPANKSSPKRRQPGQFGGSSSGSSPKSSPDRRQRQTKQQQPPPPRSRTRSPSPSGSESGGKAAATQESREDDATKRSRSDSRSSRSRSRSSSSSSSASDVTDVSPLSSPRQDSPRAAAAAAGGATSSSGRPPRAAAAGSSHQNRPTNVEERDEDRINMETIVRALVELDKRRCQSAGPQRSGFHSGTQSMSRIHDIEAENQRLLYNLMRTKNRNKKPNNIDPPVKRPHHSTVNRQKEQRRIEEENRKIFQRLKQIRPTRGMSRNEMITDYKRQASFGLPLSLLGEEAKFRQPKITQNPYCQPVSRVHSSSSMVHPGGAAAGGSSTASSRPASANARGTRTRGGGGGGGGASSGRPGWPSGW